MTEFNEKLYKLFLEELDNLHLGHPFNKERLNMMKDICRLITYYDYTDDDGILKLIKYYEY